MCDLERLKQLIKDWIIKGPSLEDLSTLKKCVKEQIVETRSSNNKISFNRLRKYYNNVTRVRDKLANTRKVNEKIKRDFYRMLIIIDYDRGRERSLTHPLNVLREVVDTALRMLEKKNWEMQYLTRFFDLMEAITAFHRQLRD